MAHAYGGRADDANAVAASPRTLHRHSCEGRNLLLAGSEEGRRKKKEIPAFAGMTGLKASSSLAKPGNRAVLPLAAIALIAATERKPAIFAEPLWLAPILALLLGYLLGSIPFGIVVTRMGGAGDLRAIGSGNIGATNVLRTGRKGLAALTLLLDIAKGFLAVWLAARLGPEPDGLMRLGAIGALFGHCFSVFLRFEGGKGVAVLLGIALALEPAFGIAFAIVWVMLAALVRYSSVAGIAATIMLPIIAGFFGDMLLGMLFFAFALLVVWKHRANIARLLRGDEPRIGEGGEPSEA